MTTLAANILIDVSNNNEITTTFTNINKTVFNGNRCYNLEETAFKLKDVTSIFNEIAEVSSYGCLELIENCNAIFLPGSSSYSVNTYKSFCTNQSLFCRQIVAAIAYFVECLNKGTNSSYTYPIKIKYKDYEMNLNTLEDITTFIKYEG